MEKTVARQAYRRTAEVGLELFLEIINCKHAVKRVQGTATSAKRIGCRANKSKRRLWMGKRLSVKNTRDPYDTKKEGNQ